MGRSLLAAAGSPVALDLPLVLDRGGVSLQSQLTEQLRRAINAGQLAGGTRLPSSRTLAATLGVSRNVVVAAYDELFAEGYVTGRHGSGTFVEHDLPLQPQRRPAPGTAAHRWLRPPPVPPATHDRFIAEEPGQIVFRVGMPATTFIPPEVWRQVWRAVGGLVPPAHYGETAGERELRDALAQWVGRARGIACRAEDVVITTGAVQSLDLIARATLARGDRVAFEEPGYPTARRLLEAHGAVIAPVPVDDDGIRVGRLPAGPGAPPLVYVTPSHQYPLGGRLPIARRLALLDWARRHDSLIVEDDYDSEFRFDAPPLPALLGLDQGGVVAYIGTFAKTLAPTLRLGYVIAPPPLRERVVALKELFDRHTSWPIQRAALVLLREGHLERHIRRVRRHYAELRAILRDGLAPVTGGPRPAARLLGLAAGLHACLELAPGGDAARVAADAHRRGVEVTTLAGYYAGIPDRQGLVLGYGGLFPADLRRGATILAEVIAAARAR